MPVSLTKAGKLRSGAVNAGSAFRMRAEATALRGQLAQLVDVRTWLAVHAERAVSRALGGSCSMPLAAHATWQGGTLHISAALGDSVNTRSPLLHTQQQADIAQSVDSEPAARALGERAAQALQAAGAAQYLPAPH
jgi:hydroxymethylbilane synthase